MSVPFRAAAPDGFFARPLRPAATSVAVLALALLAPAAAPAQQEEQDLPGGTEGAAPESRTMRKALKLYRRGDYYSASIELHKVVEGETGDAEETRQKAEFWMGKTLFHLGFFAASLSYFDRVVQAGEAHPYYRATLKWLASLAARLPESAGILEKIGRYSRVELEQPELDRVRHELFYLMGRYSYTQGDLKEARSLFAEVSPKTPYYIKAKFFEAMTHAREGDGAQAAETYKVMLRYAIANPDVPEVERFGSLAQLSLARVFYSVAANAPDDETARRQFETALKYYDRVPPESEFWLAAMFESSWAHFQLDDFQKALGNIHTLNAPYFEDQFFPESLILKAVIYWKNCVYDRSAAAITEFNETYPPVKKELDALLEKYQDPLDFFEVSQKIRKADSGLPPVVERLARSFLNDRTVSRMFEYVDELDRELGLLRKADAAWQATAVAASVLQDLTLQQSLGKNEAGQLARARVERGLYDETGIQDLIKQAIKVEFETLNAQRGAAEAELREEQVAGPTTRGPIAVRIDDEHQMWPFSGEYWKDELGSYRFRLRSQCR